MKTFSKKLDEILISFFNEVESDVHSGNNKDGIVYTKAGTKAKQSIAHLIHQAEIKAKIDEVNNMPSGCEEYSIPRAMALEKEIVNE